MRKNGVWILSAMVAAALASSASAQPFVQPITDFEGSFTAPVFLAEVIFRDPGLSTSTRGIVLGAGTNDSYLTNIVTVPSPFSEVNSGTQSMASFWEWANPADHTSWVRLSTLDTTDIPSPSLHLGGKVRMYVGLRAFTSNTFGTQAPGGNVWIGIGVRETGLGTPMGDEGGGSGDVEWVGLSDKLAQIVAGTNGICDTAVDPMTDDVQIVAQGMPAPNNGVCIDGGTNGIVSTPVEGDDRSFVTPVGLYSVPADGVMRLYEFDLPALETSGNVFSLLGDDTLGATPNNRGTLDHLMITNDPGNAAANAKVMLLFIDDVEFEAPIPNPPVVPVEPAPEPLAEFVDVEGIDLTATLLEVDLLGKPGIPGQSLNSLDPAGSTQLTVATPPLPSKREVVARQTVSGVSSDNSTPVLVNSLGNGALRLATAIRETDEYDNALDCGDDGTGFDPDQPSTLEFIGAESTSAFGVPNGRRFTPQPDWFEVTFNPCEHGITIFSGNGEVDTNGMGDTVGVWEGLYFRIDNQTPTRGPFTVYIDDLTVKNGYGTGMDCFVDDFESYTPGTFIVGDFGGNGIADTLAEPTDIQVVPVNDPVFPGQIIVDPGPDGTLETVAQGDDGTSVLHARFNFPGAAGTSIGVAPTPNRSEVTAERSFNGDQSLKIQWAFVDTVNLNNVLRLTSNGSLATNPPETFLNPDSVIPVEYLRCDDEVDAEFSVMMLIEPPPIPGDCDQDGDVDLADIACMQLCFGESPVPSECEKVSLAPNGAPDNVIDLGDYELFSILISGPE